MTDNQAFIGPPEVRAALMAALRAAFARTAEILQNPDTGSPTHPVRAARIRFP
jgi:hypothetical protein